MPLHFPRLVGRIQGRPQSAADLRLRGGTLHSRFAIQGGHHPRLQYRQINARLLEDRHDNSPLLLNELQQDVCTLELRVRRLGRQSLSRLERLLKFDSKLFESHDFLVAGSGP